MSSCVDSPMEVQDNEDLLALLTGQKSLLISDCDPNLAGPYTQSAGYLEQDQQFADIQPPDSAMFQPLSSDEDFEVGSVRCGSSCSSDLLSELTSFNCGFESSSDIAHTPCQPNEFTFKDEESDKEDEEEDEEHEECRKEVKSEIENDDEMQSLQTEASPCVPQVTARQSCLPTLSMFDTRLQQNGRQDFKPRHLRSRSNSCSSGISNCNCNSNSCSNGISNCNCNSSSNSSSSSSSSSSIEDRDASLQRQADYIRAIIESRVDKPQRTTSKVKVHEVILVMLLHPTCGDRSVQLDRILTFCDSDGVESRTSGSHFKALDTEAMGTLWQKIKRNRKRNYDTFARAMRVRRERSEGFFEYLEAGKGKRKKIYRMGSTCIDEMRRLQRTLGEFRARRPAAK